MINCPETHAYILAKLLCKINLIKLFLKDSFWNNQSLPLTTKGTQSQNKFAASVMKIFFRKFYKGWFRYWYAPS